MGTEGFQEGLNGILFFFHMGGSQSYIRVPFPGFLQQRLWDPSVFLGLERFLCLAGLQTPRGKACAFCSAWQNAA